MPLRLFLIGLLLLAAVGLGLVGYQVTRPPKIQTTAAAVPAAPPPPATIDVLVAAHSLPSGTLMKAEDLIKRAVPTAEVPKGALIDNPEVRAELRGALLRRYLDSGNILITSDVLHPRDRGFLAAVLASGTRAISVGVDPVTGDGGMIWPGDRVDLILTQELDLKDTPRGKRFVGETVLNDVRVVAVDQSIAQGASGDNVSGRLARTITLEVTPEQAERAALAQRLGTITLCIRAVDSAAGAIGNRTSVYGGDISPALADDVVPTPTAHMRIIEGKDAREVKF
jgi:pilus assembly protein CpaB